MSELDPVPGSALYRVESILPQRRQFEIKSTAVTLFPMLAGRLGLPLGLFGLVRVHSARPI